MQFLSNLLQKRQEKNSVSEMKKEDSWQADFGKFEIFRQKLRYLLTNMAVFLHIKLTYLNAFCAFD
jgi:hypothetical protein